MTLEGGGRCRVLRLAAGAAPLFKGPYLPQGVATFERVPG